MHVTHEPVHVEERQDEEVELQVGIEHVAAGPEVHEVADGGARVAFEAQADIRDLDFPVGQSRQYQRRAVGEGQLVTACPGFVS